MGIVKFLKNIFRVEKVEKKILVEVPLCYSSAPIENDTKFFDKNDYPFGTIIWAKRYNNEEEMNAILEGHREGPYIVVDVDEENDRLVCLYCTTTVPKYKSIFYRILNVGDIGFNSFKSTYVCVSRNEFITKERYEKSNGCLSLEYQNELRKKIDLVYREDFYLDYDFSKFKMPLASSDIISFKNRLYLIISEGSDFYKCVEITDDFTGDDKKDDKFIVGRIVYKVMYDSFDYISKKDSLKRYDTVSDRTFNLILKKMKNYYENIGERSICRGTLIGMNDSLFYVYGEEGTNWLLFEIFKGYKEDLCNFNINGRTYYSNFKNTITISKKEKLNIATVATETEIDDKVAETDGDNTAVNFETDAEVDEDFIPFTCTIKM